MFFICFTHKSIEYQASSWIYITVLNINIFAFRIELVFTVYVNVVLHIYMEIDRPIGKHFHFQQALETCKQQEELIEEMMGPLERRRSSANAEFAKVCKLWTIFFDEPVS